MKKLLKNKGIISIEASLVLTIFVIGYLLLNYILISVYVESSTKKVINAIADDLVHISILSNDTILSDYLTKTENIDLLEASGQIISENIDLDLEDYGYENILENLKILARNRVKEGGGNLAFNLILREMFKEKSSQLGFNFFDMIDGREEGLDFRNTVILPKDKIVDIRLDYNLAINSFNMFGVSRKLNQRSYIGKSIYNGTEEAINEPGQNESIWQETNFKRGRYFSAYLRENSSFDVLKTGHGLDLYNQAENKFYQFHSINVFTSYYSSNQNDKYAISYDNLYSQINNFYNEMLANIEKIGGNIVLENGSTKQVEVNPRGVLVLVFPEEAESMLDLKRLLNNLRSVGVEIETKYLEKAL